MYIYIYIYIYMEYDAITLLIETVDGCEISCTTLDPWMVLSAEELLMG